MSHPTWLNQVTELPATAVSGSDGKSETGAVLSAIADAMAAEGQASVQPSHAALSDALLKCVQAIAGVSMSFNSELGQAYHHACAILGASRQLATAPKLSPDAPDLRDQWARVDAELGAKAMHVAAFDDGVNCATHAQAAVVPSDSDIRKAVVSVQPEDFNGVAGVDFMSYDVALVRAYLAATLPAPVQPIHDVKRAAFDYYEANKEDFMLKGDHEIVQAVFAHLYTQLSSDVVPDAAVQVAYADPQAFKNFAAGTADKEWMWAKPDAGLVPMYIVSPAPVQVGDTRDTMRPNDSHTAAGQAAEREWDEAFKSKPGITALVQPADTTPVDVVPLGLDKLHMLAAQHKMAMVPLQVTRAMQDVLEDEGWQWEDLLAAAEAITDEQYAEIGNGPTSIN